jgi:hypothetical protein
MNSSLQKVKRKLLRVWWKPVLLFQVQSLKPRSFTAGFCVDGQGLVWETAPILSWMKEKPLTFIQSYCKNKGWKLVHVSPD